MDLDLRKVRYFLTVADELNFSRAAERLHIAQPVLSRQIRALESELHAQLLVRDHQHTELTEAGRQLQAEGALLLAGAAALSRRVRQAAGPARTFTVGFMPGLIVTGPVRALGAAHPGLAVEVLRTSWDDQVAVLHDGRADVSYLRMPVDTTGLVTRPLRTEPRVAALPASHRLAGKDGISLRDLAGEHLLQHADAVPEWRDVAAPASPLAGASARPGPPGTAGAPAPTVEEKLEHVAAGRGFSVLPESTATYYQRPDVTWVPITDIPPGGVRLAWASVRRSPLIAEFAVLALADAAPDAAPGA
jgi:DNA-binding transcriptional LysR family regulator